MAREWGKAKKTLVREREESYFMIVTTTLNTSIDKRYQLAGRIADHEVQRVVSLINTAGGKGLNCTRSIVAFGDMAIPTGFVGGFNGKYLCSLLAEDGLAHDFVHVATETRSCINVLDKDGASTEFLEPGAAISAGELSAFEKKFNDLAKKADVITLNGSLPKGVPTNFYAKLIETAHLFDAPVLLDTSGDALVQALPALPDLIKPNLDEISALLDRGENSEAARQCAIIKKIKTGKMAASFLPELAALAKHVSEKYGIAYVVLSLGKEGALIYARAENVACYGKPPTITAINPVGSGDTMVGAFAHGIAHGLDTKDLLGCAIAAASANCLSEKPGFFKKADYAAIRKEVAITEVQCP